jgi:hypothetical protein
VVQCGGEGSHMGGLQLEVRPPDDVEQQWDDSGIRV